MYSQPNNTPPHHSKILDELKTEAISVAKISGEAVTSFAWLWPLRGILYTATRE